MRRLVALALTFAVVALGPAPLVLAQGGGMDLEPGQKAAVEGQALDAAKNPLANHTVRLRNLTTGEITSVTQSTANGSFSFAGINPGNFAVEIVNSAGQVVATSSTIAVAAGATATVTVTASAIGAMAAGAGATGLAGLFTGASAVALAAAGVAVVVGVVATRDDASPSR